VRLMLAFAATTLLLIALLAAALLLSPRPRPLSSSSVAFLVGGDIYTVALADGAPHLLADWAVDFDTLQYSPDGESLIARDVLGRIWILPTNGDAPRYVADGALPTWSPTARQLAMLHQGQLTVLDVTTGESRILDTSDVVGSRTALRWTRDGSAILVSTCTHCHDLDGAVELRVPLDGSVASTIGNGLWDGSGASTSHDGKRLAAIQCPPNGPPDCQLVVIDSASGAQMHLAATDQDPFNPVAWSPDDAWLVYSEYKSGQNGATTLVRIDVATGRRTDLAATGGALNLGQGPGFPVISADGAWVLYSIPSDNPSSELRLVRSDGTDDQLLIKQPWPNAAPTWIGQTMSWEATDIWPIDVHLAAASVVPADPCNGQQSADDYYVAIDALDGCAHLSQYVQLQLDLDPDHPNAPDIRFDVDASGVGGLARLTQAHITIVGGDGGDACPRAVGASGSWPESVRLDQVGSDRLCVLTNRGALVELRLDPWYAGEGPLTIHYRTVEGAKP
jgi:hypothetical protein